MEEWTDVIIDADKKKNDKIQRKKAFIHWYNNNIDQSNSKQTNAYFKRNFKTLRGTDAKIEEKKKEENTL